MNCENTCNKVENVTHTYDSYDTWWQKFLNRPAEKYALDDVSFTLNAGSSLGIIGKDGPGKKTMLRILAGTHMLAGTWHETGSVELLGKNWRENDKELKPKVRCINGNLRYFHITPEQYIEFQNEIFPQKGRIVLGVDDLVPMFGMQEFYQKKIGELNLGEKMRADFAGGLAAGVPEILLLDEITNGLDDITKHEIREIINKIRKQFGTTVVMTSQDMDDIEAVCRRLLVLDKGRNIAKKGELANSYARVGNLIDVRKWTNEGAVTLKEKVLDVYERLD